MILALFRAVAAAELLLSIIYELVPQTRLVLPMGGTELAQIGLLFASVFIASELRSNLKVIMSENDASLLNQDDEPETK